MKQLNRMIISKPALNWIENEKKKIPFKNNKIFKYYF